MSYIYVLVIVALFVLAFIVQFHPVKSHAITDDLYAVRTGFVNFYAYRTSEGIVLFDTGMSAGAAKRQLRKLGIDVKSVSHVILTHTDYDHAGGLAAFTDAKLYISANEVQMINGETARRGFKENRKLTNFHKTPSSEPSKGGFLHNTLKKDFQTLAHREALHIGDTSIEVRVTPGHTTGSAIYMIDDRYLVTGDLLRIPKGGSVQPFLWLMNRNHQELVNSLEGARAMIGKAEIVLSGHSGILRQNQIKE